ncbi:MAG: sulfatase-like hydrolase/transferase [Candidatus Woykebacteria bacterium]
MKQLTQRLVKILYLPLHPFLFAIYPILFIYSNNLNDIFLKEIISPIFISLGTTIFVFYTIKFILKDIYKSTLLTSVALIIFFSFGHLFNLVNGLRIGQLVIGPNKFILFMAVLSSIILFIIIRLKTNLKVLAKYLNIVVLVLILLSVTSIGINASNNSLRVSDIQTVTRSRNEDKSKVMSKTDDKHPDIYYIMLDGYGSQNSLQKTYKFDNSGFINFLKQSGFYVANKSHSNYTLTPVSLASSLNMRYLDDIANMKSSELEKRLTAIEILRNNEVAKFFKSKGYKFVNIGSSWGVTSENPYADLVYRYKARSEFAKILYQTTALVLLETRDFFHADSVLFAFDKVKDIPKLNEPTFTFVHIVSPHPPYVFDQDGNKLKTYDKRFDKPDSWYNEEAYINQLIFVNKKVKEAVSTILSKSKIPPIIIIQSDHGPGSVAQIEQVSKERFELKTGILNAYYLPNGGDKIMYQSISPVNSFRKIFNYYFNQTYPLLPDESNFSEYKSYFVFIKSPTK